MVNKGGKRLKLYSFVKKVKGEKNWVLEDLLRKKLFRIVPGGESRELEESLLKEDLVYKTAGIRPHEFEFQVKGFEEFARLRKLQIRVTGECDHQCEDCGQICSCYKGGPAMSGELLDTILEQVRHIPIRQVWITGGNPFLTHDLVEKIDKEISAEQKFMIFQGTPGDTNGVMSPPSERLEISQENMKVDTFTYFYYKKFNPCWGNTVGIDANGDIKPCLWSDEIVGNIQNDDIIKMILHGRFEKYWKLNKDKIETCKACEYRYACSDCRVLARKSGGSLYSKSPQCSYEPSTGCWQ